MRWPWQASETTTSVSEAELSEAARALAAILSTTPSETRAPVAVVEVQQPPKDTKGRWWTWSRQTESKTDSSDAATTASLVSSEEEVADNEWTRLPQCPVEGYVLDQAGLHDTSHTPPHSLSRMELRELIKDITVLEQETRYNLDCKALAFEPRRSVPTAAYVPSVAFSAGALYLLTWQLRRIYCNALPRQSFLLRHRLTYNWLRRRSYIHNSDSMADLTPHAARVRRANEEQSIARRHTALLRMTNASVMMTCGAGVGLLALAAVLLPARPSQGTRNVNTVTPKEAAAAQQRHFQATLKWLWYVYYHHPAYYRPT